MPNLEALLATLWPPFIVQAILQIPLGTSDLVCWRDEPAGSCTYKSLYNHLFQRSMGPALPLRTIWQLDTAHKTQLFCWRLLLDKLPTRDRLSQWNDAINPICLICCRDNEMVDHLFTHCSFSRLVWKLLPSSIQTPSAFSSISFWFWNLASESDSLVEITLCWYLWKSRNSYIFYCTPINPLTVFHKTQQSLFLKDLCLN